MIDYFRDKNAMLLSIFFSVLLILLSNLSWLQKGFSDYLEHSQKLEPSPLQLRMIQYKKILLKDEDSYFFYEKHLTKLLDHEE